MSIKSGFFNSQNGDRVYNADDLTNFYDGILNDGVIKTYMGALEVTAGTGMAVNVAAGKALVLGKYILNNSILNLSVEGSEANPRFDAVVCGVDLETRTGNIYIKKGEASAVPSYPDLNNTGSKKEIALAYISVAAGATSIIDANITDTRPDPNVCGWVNISDIEPKMKTLKNHVEITTPNTSEILINIQEYDAINDQLFVYLNGFLLTESTDYTETGTGSAAKITLVNAIQETNNNYIDFIVCKIEF